MIGCREDERACRVGICLCVVGIMIDKRTRVVRGSSIIVAGVARRLLEDATSLEILADDRIQGGAPHQSGGILSTYSC